MATLSRVLAQTDGEVQPVTWRSSGSETGGPPAARPPRSTPSASKTSLPTPGSAELEAQVNQQLQVAFEAGVREGEAAARQKLEADVRQAVERLALAASEVTASRADALRRAEADLVRLSLEIARRVLHREVSIDPAALSALVRAALEKLASQQICRLRVHPDQEAMVRATLAQVGRASDVEVVTDQTQPRGAALFDTDSGSLDASVETQLREIERGFADRLQERP